jgi:hypothetical protein
VQSVCQKPHRSAAMIVPVQIDWPQDVATSCI